MSADPSPLPHGLYITATPIGNLADISARALDVLTRAGVIAAEDTRVTGKLLHRYGIATPMLAYHDHNADRMRPELLRRAQGEAVALVSDAGTPLISDPGCKLVRAAADAGIAVFTIPGPSALTAAVSIAGLPTDRLLFLGFLPARTKARQDELAAIASVRATLVLYESPQRLAACLADAAAVLGARDAAVCRELTKAFEEVRRGPLPALAAHYAGAGAPKGEIVVVIGPAGEAAEAVDVDALLREALAQGSLKAAVERVTARSGLPRGQVYQRALALKGDS